MQVIQSTGLLDINNAGNTGDCNCWISIMQGILRTGLLDIKLVQVIQSTGLLYITTAGDAEDSNRWILTVLVIQSTGHLNINSG